MTGLVNSSDTKVEFAYDYKGRRFNKTVYEWTGSDWSEQTSTTFAYNGWNVFKENKVEGSETSTKDYIWGLDLSQSLQGAGGVGGLLATIADNETDFHAYDANGNTGQLINASTGAIDAHYEYDPFGRTIKSVGDKAETNAYRFSSKYFDAETSLYYYGYRYYDVELGRWNRTDPHNENAFKAFVDSVLASDRGMESYNRWARIEVHPLWFVANNPVNKMDKIGLQTSKDACKTCGKDVKLGLWITQTDVKRRWEQLNDDQKKANCEPFSVSPIKVFNSPILRIRAAGGWDMSSMLKNSWNYNFTKDGCGKGCKESVSLEGKCRRNWNVNYLLYGWLNKHCGISRTWMLAHVLGWKPVKGFTEGIWENPLYPSLYASAGYSGYPHSGASLPYGGMDKLFKDCKLCKDKNGKLYEYYNTHDPEIPGLHLIPGCSKFCVNRL